MTTHAYYGKHNRKMFGMVLKAALKLAKDLLFPIFAEMDRKPPALVDGEIRVHPLRSAGFRLYKPEIAIHIKIPHFTIPYQTYRK